MVRVTPLMVSVVDRLIQCSIRAIGKRFPSTDGIQQQRKIPAIPPSGLPGTVAALGMKMLWVTKVASLPEDTWRLPPFFKKPLKKTSDKTVKVGKKDIREQDVGQKSATESPAADALRNRDRLLEAAKTVFSAGDLDASLEAVARTAGDGIGTLYRHFPTREVPCSRRLIAMRSSNGSWISPSD